jgi:hypothetical protein
MQASLATGEPAQRPAWDGSNPDHHIWNNNGTYFIHVTLRWNGQRKLRLRKSLGTKDRIEARRRRDHWLVRMRQLPELELLIR